MHAPCMQASCRTHATCCSLLHPVYRRTQAAYGRNTSDMQAACRSKCGHLHWKTAVNSRRRRPAAGCSILQQGVDALHAGFMQPACRASMTCQFKASFSWRHFLFLAFLHRKCTSIYSNFIAILFVSSRFGPNFLWHSSSLNLRRTHCNLFRFSVNMPCVWNSFLIELRTDYSLRAWTI